MPVLFSVLIAIAITPISNKLESKGMNRTLAAVLIIGLGTLITTGIIFIVFLQAQNLVNAMPELSAKIESWIIKLAIGIEDLLNITRAQQQELLASNSKEIFSNNISVITNSFTAIFDFMSFMAITPFNLLFLMIYRENFRIGLRLASRSQKMAKRNLLIIKRVQNGLQAYVKGLMLIITIIATLNSVGFLIVGLDYAILLAVISALLTLIPYIGVVLGAFIPFMVALVTKDQLMYPIAVLGIAAFVQFLEGNFLTPRIIGSQVGVNPFFIILSVILMASLSGIIGMILAAPLLAITKIICANVEVLKPVSIVLSSNNEAATDSASE
ncbi:MAG: AI-2E family transporter [Salibacteraceae bacterium]